VFKKKLFFLKFIASILFISFFIFLSVSCVALFSHPFEPISWVDSNRSSKVIRSYKTLVETPLLRLKDNKLFEISKSNIDYGACSYSRFFIKFRGSESKKRIFITGGVHGNEPSGTLSVVALLLDIATSPGKYRYLTLEVIPCVNPWSFEHNVRYSYYGYDLNRCFSGNVQAETQFVIDNFNGSYDLLLDLHEASAKHYFVYSHGFVGNFYAKRVKSSFVKRKIPMESEYEIEGVSPLNGIFYLPRIVSLYSYYRGEGTLGDYSLLKGAKGSLTLESSKWGA